MGKNSFLVLNFQDPAVLYEILSDRNIKNKDASFSSDKVLLADETIF
jgi:hypothetical protein